MKENKLSRRSFVRVYTVSVGRHLMPLLQQGAEAVANRMKAMTSELAGVMTATGVRNLQEMDPTVIHRV